MGEFRCGRPVLISHGDMVGLIATAESLDDEMLGRMSALTGGAARLVLTDARWRHLGMAVEDAGAVVPDELSAARILNLACAEDLDFAGQSLVPSRVELAGLNLARLALLLPAVVSFAVDTHSGEALSALVRVEAEAIDRYRERQMSKVEMIADTPVPLEMAPNSRFVVFRGGEGLRDQIAVVVSGKAGEPDPSKPVLVRLHSACLTGDLFGSLKCDCGDQLRGAVAYMAEHGGGVVLYLDQEGRGNGISNKLRAYRLQAEGHDTFEADQILGFDLDQRHFEFAANMLKQLGFTSVKLLTNNPAKIAALQQAGLTVVGSQRLNGRLNSHNRGYLSAKRERAGHMIDKALLGVTGIGQE
mgnify:CR=1 FL=1